MNINYLIKLSDVFYSYAKFTTSKIKVAPSPGKGNGLFATKFIKKGEVIVRSPMVEISDEDWKLIKHTMPVKLYGFRLGDKHALQPGPFPFPFESEKERKLWEQTKFKGCNLSGFNFINGADSPEEVNCREKFTGDISEIIATRDIDSGEEILKQYNVPVTFQTSEL